MRQGLLHPDIIRYLRLRILYSCKKVGRCAELWHRYSSLQGLLEPEILWG